MPHLYIKPNYILQIKYFVVLLYREYLQSLLTMLKCAGLFILGLAPISIRF